MKRRITLTLILTALVCLLLTVGASAAVVALGTCGADGDNLTWTLDTNGFLTISGVGDMQDFALWSSPWYGNRSQIKSVILGPDITSIGKYAFYNCDGLTEVVIPDAVTRINYQAFAECESLSSVIIGNSVTIIGQAAFNCCYNLLSINIPDSVTTIGREAFGLCCSLKEVTIGNSVTTLGKFAFDYCTEFTQITIGNSFMDFSGLNIYNCKNLQFINVSPDNPHFCSVDGVLYSKDKSVLIRYPCKKEGTDYIIPDSVSYIKNAAFANCAQLTSITIANTVTSMGNSVFLGCAELTSVTIPASVEYIGSATLGNKNLQTVTFLGNAPIFASDVFNKTSATAYYPADDDTWTEAVRQNYGGTVTWVAKNILRVVNQPEDAFGYVGEDTVFSITVTGNDLKYQWQYKTSATSGWSNSSNGRTNTLAVEALFYRNGYQYRCKVTDGDGNTVTTNAVTLTVKPAFSITKQPVSTTLTTGDTATFKITAQGDGLTYKWQYKSPSSTAWSNSSNGKTDTLNVEALSYRNGYKYRCIVTDADGKQLISNAVTLNVKPVLTITKQPTSATVTTGNTAKFTVTASGSGISYQWQYKSTGSSGWSNSSSGKTASFSVEALSYRNGYQYRCKITDGTNTIYSDVVTLTVKPALSITKQPVSATASVGETATFTVTASGSGLKYQWQYKSTGSSGWSNSSSGKSATFSMEALTYRDGYQYRCKITDGNDNTVTTNAVTLTVKPALSITKQPVSATASVGEKVAFTVSATGENVSYQWQYKSTGSSGWSNSSSGKSATLSVEALSYRDGYQYRCKITDGTTTIYSDAVTLTVKK